MHFAPGGGALHPSNETAGVEPPNPPAVRALLEVVEDEGAYLLPMIRTLSSPGASMSAAISSAMTSAECSSSP